MMMTTMVMVVVVLIIIVRISSAKVKLNKKKGTEKKDEKKICFSRYYMFVMCGVYNLIVISKKQNCLGEHPNTNTQLDGCGGASYSILLSPASQII